MGLVQKSQRLESIPLGELSEIVKTDLGYREKDPDTIDVQFMEATPVTKLLYTFRPEELGIIKSIGFGLGPTDNSVNGFAYLMLSRIPNPSFFSTDFGNNQVMWRKIAGSEYKADRDYFNDEPLYMQKGEPFYLFLASNYPAPVKAYGHITLYCLATHR